MIAIVTQNHAIVNITDFECIFVDKNREDENDKHYYIKLNNGLILGQYDNVQDAIEIIEWIASAIGSHHTNENLVLSMPFIVSEEKKKDNTDDSNVVGEV